MASETSSSLVLFIAAIAIAGIAAAAMAGVVGSMANELRGRGDAMAQTIATDISIANDPENIPLDDANDNVTVYIKNTGTATLVTEDTLILIEGQTGSYDVTLVGGETRWLPGVVAAFTVSSPTALTDGDDIRIRATYSTVADNLDGRVVAT